MIQVQATLQGAMDVLTGFLTAHASAGAWYTALVRFLFPILAVLMTNSQPSNDGYNPDPFSFGYER